MAHLARERRERATRKGAFFKDGAERQCAMYDLTKFNMANMVECGMALRTFGPSSQSMEEAADKIVRFLYRHLLDPKTGKNAVALVRFFKTHDYDELPPDLKASSSEIVPSASIPPGMKCLTLLASAGDEAEWNSRNSSRGHKAIPLPSQDFVRQFPMISSLVRQFGLELNSVLRPDPSCLRDLDETTYNVFHVPTALGSAYIPAQEDFVIPYGIESTLGFGGMLPSGNLFATIMFFKVPISHDIADLFQPLTLSVKIAVLQHDTEQIFRQSEDPARA